MKNVLKEALKESDNLAAEALFYHVGKHVTGKTRSLSNSDGQAAVGKIMKDLVGMDPENYNIADGSGVSLYNYVSPRLLLSYLNYAYRNPSVFHPFMIACPSQELTGHWPTG